MNKKTRHPLILLLLALVFVGLGCVGGIAFKLLLQTTGILHTIPGRILQVTFFILITTFFYRLYLKKFEHCTLWQYKTDKWKQNILLGITIGTGLILLQVIPLLITGNYRFESFNPSPEIIKYFFFMILIGFTEELLTRGVIFRLVEKWAGSLIALLVVTIEGALTHASNPNATLWSSIAVGLEFGILMSLIYMATRNLWVVSAMHFAWNFTMGGLLDVAVSGTEAQSLFKANIQGPDWLTGGAFGFEAGAPAIVVTVIASLILIQHLRKNNGFRAPEHREKC